MSRGQRGRLLEGGGWADAEDIFHLAAVRGRRLGPGEVGPEAEVSPVGGARAGGGAARRGEVLVVVLGGRVLGPQLRGGGAQRLQVLRHVAQVQQVPASRALPAHHVAHGGRWATAVNEISQYSERAPATELRPLQHFTSLCTLMCVLWCAALRTGSRKPAALRHARTGTLVPWCPQRWSPHRSRLSTKPAARAGNHGGWSLLLRDLPPPRIYTFYCTLSTLSIHLDISKYI